MQGRDARTARTAKLIEQLLGVANELDAMHPGRKFPLDGHLVGSIVTPGSRFLATRTTS